MVPFGIESLPSDVVTALKAVPHLADRLDEVAASTSEMAAMRAGINSLGEDTGVLRDVSKNVAEINGKLDALAGIGDCVQSVAGHTAALPEMTAKIDSIERRMMTIEEAMPALAEVQGSLAKLPETMDRLGTGLDKMAGLMDQLLLSLNALDGNVGALRDSMEPIGRIADRLPGSGPGRS
jgi:uncharacterized protein YoxC